MPPEDLSEDKADRFIIKVALSLIFAAIVAIVVLWAFGVNARTLYPGQWAQVDPEERRWFNNQHVTAGPYKGSSCCSLADGTYAEEDIRGDHYWARFSYSYAGKDYDSGWMEMPDDSVIHDPNRHGRTTVWYGVDDDAGDAHVFIRCFAPGAGI
jgi:hypothetical protein